MSKRDAWAAGRRRAIPLLALTLIVAPKSSHAQASDAAIPHLRRQGTATQLIVNGAPFMVLGGELGNSSASTMSYMDGRWATLAALHLNTVIAPAYWEMIEPKEGSFDFRSVDALLTQARAHRLHVVLLWFGSWKNSMSSYAPAWVKTNQSRFPRTEAVRGDGQEILAPYDSANWNADLRAFRALMRHLREFDGRTQTVIMVQVENEIGMLPEARDHSARADSLFAADVPAELVAYLRSHDASLTTELRSKWSANGSRASGSWATVFGADVYTDELFMAWHFARYVERVASAGKKEYALPMYVNAALIRPNYLPGRYVSAGPLPHLIDVWHAAAPSIDFLSPDIYFPNFREWTDRYSRADNPLFIPEASLGARSATNALYAFGTHDAIGFSPFSIESAPKPAENPIGKSYAILSELAPIIVAHQGRGEMAGVIPVIPFDGMVDAQPQVVKLRGLPYAMTVSFALPRAQTVASASDAPVAAVVFGDAGRDYAGPIAGALLIALGNDEMLIAGTGVSVTFTPDGPGAPKAGILSAQEGHYVGGNGCPIAG